MIFLVPEDSEILSLLLDLLLDLPLLYRSAWLVQCCQDRFDYTMVTKDPASCGTFITLSPHQPWVSCSLLPVVFSWGLLSCAHGPVQTEHCWQWSHFKFLSRSDTAYISLARASHVAMPELYMVMPFSLPEESGEMSSEQLSHPGCHIAASEVPCAI